METLLKVALTATDPTITLESGELSAKAVLSLDQEIVYVQTALTPTQGRILRGMDGTRAAAHPVGTMVTIQGMPDTRQQLRDARDAGVGQLDVQTLPFGEAWVKQELAVLKAEVGRLNDDVAGLKLKVQQSSVDDLKAAIMKAIGSVK